MSMNNFIKTHPTKIKYNPYATPNEKKNNKHINNTEHTNAIYTRRRLQITLIPSYHHTQKKTEPPV